MTGIPRIAPLDAAAAVEKGALLVCAYEDEAAYARMNLKGSISIQEFRKLRPMLDKDREIIFYCA